VAGLLLSARQPGDIDRLLPGAGRSAAAAPQQHWTTAAHAGSSTLIGDVGG